jgi:hypothetical protein
MSAIQTKYTDEQREAMGAAMAVGGLKAREVVERAAAGTLELDGRKLKPFEIANASTVRDQARRFRQRRAGEARSELEVLPARDAIENLRLRLIRVADAELTALERQKDGTRDLEKLRQAGRCIREAAAIPGRDEPRPPAPGQRDASGQHNGGATRGGLAAQIIASASRSHEDPVPSSEVEEPEPPAGLEREPALESPSDPAQEIAERVRRRLEPLMAPEPAAPEPAEYRTLPTAMSGASQLDEAREKFGWDPLRSPEPSRRRGRGTWLEDTSSIDR